MVKILYIGLGGFLGASARYLITKWVEMKWNSLFPGGTLTVNIIGSFFLGLLMMLFLEKIVITSNLKLLLTTGFLGAFTTFSTFSYETMLLIEKESFLIAGINVISNLLLSFTAVLIGFFIAKTL